MPSEDQLKAPAWQGLRMLDEDEQNEKLLQQISSQSETDTALVWRVEAPARHGVNCSPELLFLNHSEDLHLTSPLLESGCVCQYKPLGTQEPPQTILLETDGTGESNALINTEADADMELGEARGEEDASTARQESLQLLARGWGLIAKMLEPYKPKPVTVVFTLSNVLCLMLHFLLFAANHHRRGFNTTNNDCSFQKSRFDEAVECAMTLSDLSELTPGSPQYIAADYFLSMGRGIEIPAASECSWDTEFGKVYALIVIRETFQLKESSWYTHTPSEVCHWSRVECDEYARVTGLSFNNAKIKGSLPAEVAGLTGLEELKFFSNPDLVGSIPASLGTMAQLTSLQFHHTSMSGEVPSELGSLTLLEEFLMDNAQFSGEMPNEICALRRDQGGKLEALSADCGGDHPRITCTCCTSCTS